MSYTDRGGPYSKFNDYDLAALDFLYGRDGLGGDWGVGGRGVMYSGTADNDSFSATSGLLAFLGGDGTDVLSLPAARSSFSLEITDSNWLKLKNGTIEVRVYSDIESIQFSDTTVTVASLLGNISTLASANDDRLTNTTSVDSIDGSSGRDTFVCSGLRSSYQISRNGDTWTLTDLSGRQGTDTLRNFERIEFSDSKIALDISGNAGQVYRLYKAALDRTPDNGGLAYWINLADSGVALTSIATEFSGGPEFRQRYGSLGNHQFIDQLYLNVLDRSGEPSGVAYWRSVIDNNQQTREQILTGFSESSENQLAVIGLIQNGIEYSG